MRKAIEKAKQEEARKAAEAKLQQMDQEELKAKAEKANGDGKEKKEEESKAPPGNGGVTDRYVWTQTLTEVNVSIPIADNITKKDVDVKMDAQGLRVKLKGQDKPIIDGAWPEKIDVDLKMSTRLTTLCGLLLEPQDRKSSISRSRSSRPTKAGGTVWSRENLPSTLQKSTPNLLNLEIWTAK